MGGDNTQDSQQPVQAQPKDQNVYSFMMQLVQEKHGDDVESEFLETEAERLYIEFGESLLSHFEPMLDEGQKQEFDKLVEDQVTQDVILAFLTSNIENLEQKILDVLMSFREKYMAEKA